MKQQENFIAFYSRATLLIILYLSQLCKCDVKNI